jgi:hypothetical protein
MDIPWRHSRCRLYNTETSIGRAQSRQSERDILDRNIALSLHKAIERRCCGNEDSRQR